MPDQDGPSAAASLFSITPFDAQSVWLSGRGSGELASAGYADSTDDLIATSNPEATTVTVIVDTRYISASELLANEQVM